MIKRFLQTHRTQPQNVNNPTHQEQPTPRSNHANRFDSILPIRTAVGDEKRGNEQSDERQQHDTTDTSIH